MTSLPFNFRNIPLKGTSLILFSLLFITNRQLKAQNSKTDFHPPKFTSLYATSPGQSLYEAYHGRLTMISEQPYFYWIDTLGSLTLRLQNLKTKKERTLSLEAIRNMIRTLPSISFYDESRFYIIGQDNRSVLLFNFDKNKIEATYKMYSALDKGEILYTRPDSKISYLGDYLVVPTIFSRSDYKSRQTRKEIFAKSPVVVYDLKKRKPFKPGPSNFWPTNYKGPEVIPDFLPHIAHNTKDEVFMAFKYSDTLVVYNLKEDKIVKHPLRLGTEFPRGGPKLSSLAEDRKYSIEQAQIGNYRYCPKTRKHLIALKPPASFISDGRINSYYTIDWDLLCYSDDFQIERKYRLNPREDAEWYQMEVVDGELILPTNSKSSQGGEVRNLKGYFLK